LILLDYNFGKKRFRKEDFAGRKFRPNKKAGPQGPAFRVEETNLKRRL
jgi:hypothetical protein